MASKSPNAFLNIMTLFKDLSASRIIALSCLVGATIAGASQQSQGSPNFSLPWDVNGKGGNEMASANYAIKSTTGQNVIGPGTSTNFGIGAGYWTGIAEPDFRVYLPLGLRDTMP